MKDTAMRKYMRRIIVFALCVPGFAYLPAGAAAPDSSLPPNLATYGLDKQQYMKFRNELLRKRAHDPRAWNEFRRKFNLDAAGNPVRIHSRDEIEQHRKNKDRG